MSFTLEEFGKLNSEEKEKVISDNYLLFNDVAREKLSDFRYQHSLGVADFCKELAEKTLAMLPESKSKLVYRPLPGDDPKQRRPDITLAKALLGWEPKIPLAEGLAKTIEYFKRFNA